jgi:hypothetical protein
MEKIMSFENWTDNAVGQLVVGDSEDEYNNARLAMSRALGVPEPVLYDDLKEEDSLVEDASPETEDWERTLSNIIDIQERMATGMKMIQECKEVLGLAYSGQRRLPFKAFIAWKDRQSTLWYHWKALRANCMALIGDNKWLWHQYFELTRSNMDCSGYTQDVNLQWLYDLDDQVVWNFDSIDDYEN